MAHTRSEGPTARRDPRAPGSGIWLRCRALGVGLGPDRQLGRGPGPVVGAAEARHAWTVLGWTGPTSSARRCRTNPIPGQQLRRRLLRLGRDDVRRPVPDGAGGRALAPRRRSVCLLHTLSHLRAGDTRRGRPAHATPPERVLCPAPDSRARGDRIPAPVRRVDPSLPGERVQRRATARDEAGAGDDQPVRDPSGAALVASVAPRSDLAAQETHEDSIARRADGTSKYRTS